jgi:hypothetical protein
LRSELRTNCDHLLDPRIDLVDLFGRCRIIAMNHPTAPKRERPSPYFNMPYAGGPETLGEATSSVFIAHPELKAKHWHLASLDPWNDQEIPILGCSLLLSGDGPLVSGRESHGFSDNRWVEC